MLFSPHKPVLCMRLYLSLHAPLCVLFWGFLAATRRHQRRFPQRDREPRQPSARSAAPSPGRLEIWGTDWWSHVHWTDLNFLLHICQTALTVTVVVCKPCGHSHPINLVVLWTHGVAFCDTRSANGFKRRLDKLFQMSKVILPLQWSMLAK